MKTAPTPAAPLSPRWHEPHWTDLLARVQTNAALIREVNP